MQAECTNDNLDETKPLLLPTLPPWWRVLPSVVLIVIISTIDNLSLNDFIEYRYAMQYQSNSSSTRNSRQLCLNDSRMSHQSTISMSTSTSDYSSTTTISPDDLVQESTARLNVYISLAATIPAILTSILLGANCDQTGRKALIVLPFAGKVIRYSILSAVVYFHLSDLWIILSVLFDSLFGTAGLFVQGAYAYVSDCTDKKTRTTGIVVTEVFLVGTRFVPLLTVGIYLQHPNFIQAMLFTLGISLTGFLYCIFLQPESNLNVQHLNFFQQLGRIKVRETTKIFRVFFVKREGHKQRSLLLLIFAHLSLVVMLLGYSSVNYLYLYGAPFCFDSFGVSLTSVAQTVTMIILLIPCTLAVTKRTDHIFIPIVGTLAYIAQMVVLGLATKIWMVYVALCSGAVFFVLAPVIRARVTKLVERNEYALVFILASIFESGGNFAINAVGNEIYRVSLLFCAGLVFFVFALFGVLGIILLL